MQRIARKALYVILWMAGLPCAWASNSLYRCTGNAGETVFTSDRAGYSECRLVQYSRIPNSGSAAGANASTSTRKPQSNASAISANAIQPARINMPAADFNTAPGAGEPTPPADTGRPARVTRGAVYRYIKDGVTHYTNHPPTGQAAEVLFSYIETCYACAVSSAVDFKSVSLNTTDYATEIHSASAVHGVEEALVRAIIHAESAFNANALSDKGAQGLMQLMPSTAERFGVIDPYSVADNIHGGTAYLAWLLKRFTGDIQRATAAYNAGEGAVDRFGGVPPFVETQVFVERVDVLLQRYRAELSATDLKAPHQG